MKKNRFSRAAKPHDTSKFVSYLLETGGPLPEIALTLDVDFSNNITRWYAGRAYGHAVARVEGRKEAANFCYLLLHNKDSTSCFRRVEGGLVLMIRDSGLSLWIFKHGDFRKMHWKWLSCVFIGTVWLKQFQRDRPHSWKIFERITARHPMFPNW